MATPPRRPPASATRCLQSHQWENISIQVRNLVGLVQSSCQTHFSGECGKAGLYHQAFTDLSTLYLNYTFPKFVGINYEKQDSAICPSGPRTTESGRTLPARALG